MIILICFIKTEITLRDCMSLDVSSDHEKNPPLFLFWSEQKMLQYCVFIIYLYED